MHVGKEALSSSNSEGRISLTNLSQAAARSSREMYLESIPTSRTPRLMKGAKDMLVVGPRMAPTDTHIPPRIRRGNTKSTKPSPRASTTPTYVSSPRAPSSAHSDINHLESMLYEHQSAPVGSVSRVSGHCNYPETTSSQDASGK